MTVNQSINSTHPDYDDALPDWEKVDNVIDGDVNQYLRNVAKCESTQQKKTDRQKEYEEGAILHNFTLRTRDGMQGAMFLRTPTIELPDNLNYLKDNADGNGLGLEQHMQESADQVLRKGRAGLLVDMPTTEEAPTIAQMERGEMVPRIQMYKAEDILNWRTVRFGSINKLMRIVVREEYDASLFGFNSDYIPQYQYRVLGLDDSGLYYQEVWYADKQGSFESGGNIRIEPIANGSRLNYIPFFFEGADNNTYRIGTKPLLPIAELNVGHYRNSADTEENSFVCSQAMLIIALSEQVDAKVFADENPNGVQVGSRRGLNVGPRGDAKFIQAEESDKAMRLMEKKEEQAIQLGAQLITPSRQVTAETARIQQGANGSILSSISTNISDAYRKAIAACQDFLGSNGEFQLQLTQDFFYESLTAQERAQWVSEIMTGITPVELYYSRLRQTGEYPEDATNEEIERMLSEQPPMGGFAAGPVDGDE